MGRAQSSAQSLLHAGDNGLREEPRCLRNGGIPMTNGGKSDPGSFGDVSPLHEREERDNSERIDRNSPLPTMNGPLTQPLLNEYDIEMSEGPQRPHQNVSLFDSEVRAITRQDPGDTRRTNLGQQGAQFEKHS